MDGDGFGSGIAAVSAPLVADHQVGSAKPLLGARRPRPASFGHVDTDTIQGSANHADVDVSKGVGDADANVFAKGDDDDNDKDANDAHSARRSMSPGTSCNIPAPDTNASVSELQTGKHDSAQLQQLGPAGASPQRSNLKNGPLPGHRHLEAPRDVLRLRSRTTAPVRPASTVSIGPAALESNDEGTDNSSDEDYREASDAAPSETRGRPHSRKRVKRAKDAEHNDGESPSPCPLNVSYQAITTSPPDGMQESEEILISGYLTLKTVESSHVLFYILSRLVNRTSRNMAETRYCQERL